MFTRATIALVAIIAATILISTGCRRITYSAQSTWKEAAWGDMQPDAPTWNAVGDGLNKIAADLKSRGYSKTLFVGLPEKPASSSGDVASPFLLAQRDFVAKARDAGLQMEVIDAAQAASAEFLAAHPADAVVKVDLIGYGADTRESTRKPTLGSKTRSANNGVRVTLRETVSDPKTGKEIATKVFDGVAPAAGG